MAALKHHPRLDDERQPHPDRLQQQQRGKHRRRDVADAGDQADDGVEAEADAGARDAERCCRAGPPSAAARRARPGWAEALKPRPIFSPGCPGEGPRCDANHCHPAVRRGTKVCCANHTIARLAGHPVSARRHLGRRRRQLRAVLRARDARRALPVRLGRRRGRIADDSAARADRHGLARLPAGRPAGAALRLSRPRPVRAAPRPSLQPAQARHSIPTPRSIGRGRALARLAVRLHGRAATTRPSTIATARRTRRSPRSSIPRSPGATIGRRARRGTRR